MFLLDDLLLAPGKAAFALFRELARKAQEEWLDDDSIKQELQEIYAMFEAGKLSEQEFETREYQLAERLQQIATAKFPGVAALPPAAQTATPAIDIGDEPVPTTSAVAAAGNPGPAAEVPFASIADTLKPLLDLVAASVGRRGHETESGLIVRPLDDAPVLVPPRSEPPVAVVSRWSEPTVPPAAPVPAVSAAPTPIVSPPPSAASVCSAALTITQILDSALQGLSMLRLKVSSVIAVARVENGWKVTAELVERRGIPDSSDLLGVYELRLDLAGNILQWERTRMRRRCDLGQ